MSELCSVDGLVGKSCKPSAGGVVALEEAEIREQLQELEGWAYREGVIVKVYRFRDYHQTMAFANAVAWIAHGEDHHPELVIGYRTCEVRYHTHAVDGISENDLICAAKIEQLLPAESP